MDASETSISHGRLEGEGVVREGPQRVPAMRDPCRRPPLTFTFRSQNDRDQITNFISITHFPYKRNKKSETVEMDLMTGTYTDNNQSNAPSVLTYRQVV